MSHIAKCIGRTLKSMNKTEVLLKRSWLILTLSAGIGAAASFIQTVERISFADNPSVALACDVNSVFSCSSVFTQWQSSVFGFSNSIMCLLFFSVLLGIGLAGLFGGVIAKNLRLILHFFSVFFLFFGAWYLQQSTFVIGALCIFCMFCYTGVIGLNWAWVRINAKDLPLSAKNKTRLQGAIAHGVDTFFWIMWGLAIVAMFVFKFA